jgi:2-dehydropantoate 2-reductase
MLNILVVGAGAIGCFVGGRLAAAGHTVTLVGRPTLMNKIAQTGLTLRHPHLPAQTVSPKTVTSLADLSGAFEFILITVKAPDTPQVIRQLQGSGLVQPGRYLVSLQNGLGSEELLAEAFGPQQVIAGTVTIPIAVPEVGVIEVSKDKGGLGLASLQPGQPVETLAGALNQAGLTTPTYADYRAMKWSKLLLNMITNASSAILNQPPAEILARADLFNLEIEALQEAAAVMRVLGIRPVKLPGYPVDWLARLVSAGWLPLPFKRAILRPFMVSGRGTKMPSLQIDLAAQRAASEIGVLNGAIVQAGQRIGIKTPVNQALADILSGLVAGELDWTAYQGEPHKLLEAVAARRS